MAKAFDVKFLGGDVDKAINEMMKQVDPEKWQRKKNSLINKSMKMAATVVLPSVFSKMRKGKTGKMWVLTDIKRLKGGGWRIATPTRKELGIDASAKGYYPAAIEFGFDHYKSGEHWDGDHSMEEAMDENRDMAQNVARSFILLKLEGIMKRHLKQKAKK